MRILKLKRLMVNRNIPDLLNPSQQSNGIFSNASLDLPFAERKVLTDAVSGRNLITFTRTSSGTYVGSDGVLQRATTNLLVQSNQFDTTWTNTNSTETAASGIAPDGTNTAWQLKDTVDASAVAHSLNQTFAWTAGLAYTFSVWVKAGTLDRVAIILPVALFANATSRILSLTFSTGVTAVTGSPTSTSATQFSNGWWRLSITATPDNSTSASVQIRTAIAGGSTYQGDGNGTILVWGAQLEQSSTVGEYIPTTSTINSAPRFDHNPTTGESLGLLVEEQRSNLALRSEDFGTTWTTSGLLAFGSGSTLNAATAPDGTSTADLITEDTATSTHVTSQGSLSFTSGTTYTVSCFVKRGAGGRNAAIVLRAAAFSGAPRVNIDLSTGTTTLTGSGGTVGSQAYPNNWWRVTLTATATATVTSFIDIGLVSGTSTLSYTGDGTSGIYLWGAQLEAGTFPTSYIPTTAANATRSADVASITGANFSSWYSQSEGTVFAETQIPAGTAVNTSSRSVIDATDGSTNNRVNLRAIASATNTDQLTIRSGAVTVAQFASTGTNVSAAARKIAAVYKLDDYASWATGATSAATDTSGAIPVGVNQITVGSAVGGSEFMSGTIRRLTYWPARLPNSTLQTLTQ